VVYVNLKSPWFRILVVRIQLFYDHILSYRLIGSYHHISYTLISLSREASRFVISFSDILTLSPFCNTGWPQLQFSRRILPPHVCRFMHKAFVHGAHRLGLSDLSGFATGSAEGTANEKVKAVVVGVSTVC